VVGGLTALHDRVADQAHAAELADHVDALAIGLEVGVDARQLHAAGLAAVDQRDRSYRTRRRARAVADAAERIHQLRPSAHDAEHDLLRARPHARTRADALGRVDRRAQARRHHLAHRGQVLGDLRRDAFARAIDSLPQPVRQHGDAQYPAEDQ